jgi:hypothetical protein
MGPQKTYFENFSMSGHFVAGPQTAHFRTGFSEITFSFFTSFRKTRRIRRALGESFPNPSSFCRERFSLKS